MSAVPDTFKKFAFTHFGTIADFGKFVGVTYSTAWIWINYPDRIKAGILTKISDHTGVPECEIIELIKRQVNGDK